MFSKYGDVNRPSLKDGIFVCSGLCGYPRVLHGEQAWLLDTLLWLIAAVLQ